MMSFLKTLMLESRLYLVILLSVYCGVSRLTSDRFDAEKIRDRLARFSDLVGQVEKGG